MTEITHLENHPYAVVDSDGTVSNILLFADHDESLIQDNIKIFGYHKMIPLCGASGEPGIGNLYQDNYFYPPKPYPSWIIDSETKTWIPPIPKPDSGFWKWNEIDNSWQEIPFNTITGE